MSGERQDKKKGNLGRPCSIRSQDHPERQDQTGVAAQGPVTNSSRGPKRNTVPRAVQSTSTPITPESPRANVRDWDDNDERSGIPGGWPSANSNPQFRDGIYHSPSASTSWTDDLSASSQDTMVESEPQRPSQHHNRSPFGRNVMQRREPAPLSSEGSSSSHSTRTRPRAANLSEYDNRAARDPRTPTAERVEMDSPPTRRISPHATSPDNFPANADEEDEVLARVLEESRLEFEAIEQARLVGDQPNAPSYSPVVGSYSQPVAGNYNAEEDEEFLSVLEESRLEALAVEESLREEAEALERSRLEALQAKKEQDREAQAKEQLRRRVQATERLRLEAEANEKEKLRLEAESKEQHRLKAQAKEQLRLETEAKEQLRLEAEAKEKLRLEALKGPLVNPRFVSGPGDSPKALDHFIPPRTNPSTVKTMLSPSESQEVDGRDPESSLLHSILSPSQIKDFNSASDSASPPRGTTGHSQTNVSSGVRSAPPFDFPSTSFVPPVDVFPSTKLHLDFIEDSSPSLFNPSTIGEGSRVGTVDNALDSDHAASTIFSAPIMADKYGNPDFKSRYHASSDANLFPSITFSPPTNTILSPSNLENTEATDLDASEQPEAKQTESSTDFHTTFARQDHFSVNAFFPNTMESTIHNYDLNNSDFVGSERFPFQSLPREFDTTASNSDDTKDVFIPPPDSTLSFKLQNLHYLENTVDTGFEFSTIAASTSLPETRDNASSSISETPLSFFVPPVNIF